MERKEPIVLIGERGTGKTHLAIGLCLAACRQKRRVRFTTAAVLVNELVEAKQNIQLRKLMMRCQKYELIALAEVGYVPLADSWRCDIRTGAYWNAGHQSSGHVWQGRYDPCPLDPPHMWRALRYTELNPVRAGLVSEAKLWEWSSAAVDCGVGEDFSRPPMASD